jgi:hypothetical protein
MQTPEDGEHGEFIEQLQTFSQQHRVEQWRGSFSQFMEQVLPLAPLQLARSSRQSDGRNLDLNQAERVLGYLAKIWRRPIALQTVDFRGVARTLTAATPAS